MSYQVLARKWRPANFSEVVGQEHVLRALISALDNNRLHHAYLFAGTRGVGKTTLARIFAKSLNCERGVSSTPCGECDACQQIAEGRFVDLIEVDAASRTGIDDTRELLDNVQYAPTSGRYKVYLIDEVHMLSNSSFNALLKTLEEPPEHVKFLFATTDPHKLPVTVLSRCLQFNLKNLPPERIVEYLQRVLDDEQIDYEEPALWLLARSAQGSMRDALSLTDQAIAHGSGALRESEVSTMLGTVDRHHVIDLLGHVAAGRGEALLSTLDDLSLYSPDYPAVLDELLGLLHRVAIAQVVPDALDDAAGIREREQLLALASAISPEQTQVLFQMVLQGLRELPDGPSVRTAFEMVMLRMLAFRPVADDADSDRTAARASKSAAEPAPGREPGSEKKPATEASRIDREAPGPSLRTARRPSVAALKDRPAGAEQQHGERTTPVGPEIEVRLSTDAAADAQFWLQNFGRLPISGALQTLAGHLALLRREPSCWYFSLDPEGQVLYRADLCSELGRVLGETFGIQIELQITPVDPGSAPETPWQYRARRDAARRRRAREEMLAAPLVRSVIEQFDATFDEQSLTLLGESGEAKTMKAGNR